MSDKHSLPFVMTAAAALLWASSFSMVKVGLRYMDPYTFVLLRFVAASAILLVLVILTGRWRELLACVKDGYVVLLGLTLAASFGLQFRGQAETTAAKAAMIINSSVVLVAPLSVVLLGERIDLRKIIALALGVVGVYFITKSRSPNAAGPATLAGDFLIAGSALCYALYVVFTKLTVSRRRFGEVPLITAVFLWSLPAFIVAAAASSGGITVGRGGWLAIGYLAVFCSIVPFLLWTAAIRHISALTSAILLLAELVFGVVIAHVLLRETLAGMVIIGCVLVCGGIVVVGTGSRNPKGSRKGSGLAF